VPRALFKTEHPDSNLRGYDRGSCRPRLFALYHLEHRVMGHLGTLPQMPPLALIVMVVVLQAVTPQASEPSSTRQSAEDAAHPPTLERAQRFFYNGDYDRAAASTHVLCEARPDDLDACELRTASLLFQIKKALGEPADNNKTTAWNQCAVCPALLAAFNAETDRGQAFARARLTTHPDDQDTLFFLGKVDLNYVWLQLGPLGRKTGWDEYWEARRSLDRVIRMNPEHVRARVARAWVDYIVGSTVPRGVRWLLGGGNKKRGLIAVRQVAESGQGEFFDRVEAMFAFWDMQVRERDLSGAVATAQVLAHDFPENPELRRFLTVHESTARTTTRPARRQP
jgi:hypothetical protein